MAKNEGDGTGRVVTGISWELRRRIIEKGDGIRSALEREAAPTKMVERAMGLTR